MSVSLTEWNYLWLKVIAKAWSDTGFEGRLVNPGLNSSARQVIETEVGLGRLANGIVGRGNLPLPHWITLVVKPATGSSLPYTEIGVELPKLPTTETISGNPAVLLADLSEKWGALQSENERDNGGKPQPWLSKLMDAARAMASPGDVDGLQRASLALEAALQALHMRDVGDAPPGQENPTAGFDQEILWFSVWPQAVARAWKNEAFAASLMNNARLALHDQFGYDAPGGVDLTVTQSSETYTSGVKGTYPKVALTMYLPTPPTEELDGPVALSEYAGSGRSNPFTLCLLSC